MYKKGFTLIELLLVMTIIGILAVVVLSALNPLQLMKRAKDGVVTGVVVKVAFAVNAYTSATGHIPSNEGCNCDVPESCQLLLELAGGNVECHRVQHVPEGTKLWMEIKGLKFGRDLLGGQIDLDDSDAVRYQDWNGGCVTAVSEASPPWVITWTPEYGLLNCHLGIEPPPNGGEFHPGLIVCTNIRSASYRRLNCEVRA